ncbi:MAG: DUF1924 domain-containing protein [Chromatiaceae bacterium]|jgi:hypothetical protein
MRGNQLTNLLFSALLIAGTARADTASDILDGYTAAGAGPFSAAAGAELWHQDHPSNDGSARSCETCHSSDLHQRGKHAVTGKAIDPIAPSVNPERLTRRTQIEKWFRRNCKWTLGRECTAQEKGDLLAFLRTQ